MHRLGFLDALRGLALILMVQNHTSRDWMDSTMGWGRYYLVYGSLLLPAPIFLFLVGFCLPISYHRRPEPLPLARTAAAYFRRGIVIVGAGYLLNALVTPEQPVWKGGVLQTIGLAIIVLGPVLPWLRRRAGRWSLIALALLLYLSFVGSLPGLVRWAGAHPVVSRAVFNDFPPWPWLAAAIIGLVLGWTWLDARARGDDDERRFFVRVAAVGAACLVAYLAWEWWIPTTPRFGFPRDFALNGHWTPRGMTTLLIIGGVACLLSLAYWLMERMRYELRWLVILGQTALMLYVVHQLIELSLVNKLLGIRFNNWPIYWIANAAFVVLLVYLGRAWLDIKARMQRRRRGGGGIEARSVPRT